MSTGAPLSSWAHIVVRGERRLTRAPPDQWPGHGRRPGVRLSSAATISAVGPTVYGCRHRRTASRCSGEASGGGASPDVGASGNEVQESKGFFSKWKVDTAEMSARVAKLGLSAVLAYGLFDGVTYTSFFILAFLGYEKSTGKNPAANLKALLGIVILMWTGNNITRPFRVAGAAALAPIIDRGLKRIQKYFNFPSTIYAFALVVGIVAGTCFTIVGLLVLSRWGK